LPRDKEKDEVTLEEAIEILAIKAAKAGVPKKKAATKKKTPVKKKAATKKKTARKKVPGNPQSIPSTEDD
jgi:DNA topoisomerase-1